VSGVEGLELNLLSLNLGIGPSGLKLPLVGRIGPAFRPATAETPIVREETFSP